MMHPALRHLIETKLAQARAPQWELPIAEVRQGLRALWTPAMTGAPLPAERVEDLSIPTRDAPIPARVYAPDRREAYPVLVYLHGGGYVKGGLDENDTFCLNLCRLARHLVVSIDYRLAPEHPFPAALDDAIAATAWACAHADGLGAAPAPSSSAARVRGESRCGHLPPFEV